MRELTDIEIEFVGGGQGIGFVDAIAFGGGVGTLVGGTVGALAYTSTAAVAAVTAQGAAIGALLGGVAYAGYAAGNLLGADDLGRALGSELAEAKGGS